MNDDETKVAGSEVAIESGDSVDSRKEKDIKKVVLKKRNKFWEARQITEARWDEIRHAYLVKQETHVPTLAKIFGVGRSTILKQMAKENWRGELKKRYTKEQLKAMRFSGRIKDGENADDGLTLKETIEGQRERAIKSLVVTTTGLLEKVKGRMRITTVADLTDITRLIDAVQNLYEMLQGLLGFGNMGVKTGGRGGGGGGGGIGIRNRIQVNVLTQAREQADRQKLLRGSVTTASVLSDEKACEGGQKESLKKGLTTGEEKGRIPA